MTIVCETERLIMRHFTEDDADDLYALNADPDVMRYMHVTPPIPMEEIRNEILPRYIECHEKCSHFGYFATMEKETNSFIGWLHMRPAAENPILFRPGVDHDDDLELGYRFNKRVWGKGLATEGSVALMHDAYHKHGANRIIATTLSENIASFRVMEKVGMKQIDAYHHAELKIDLVQYAIERESYFRRFGKEANCAV